MSKGSALTDKIKQPDVTNCPCCGIYVRAWPNIEPTVEISCVQAHDNKGNLTACVAAWECRHCGCKWMDGQSFTMVNV